MEGWDFSWFDGRATEQRPSWGYSRLISERMAAATRALDVQTGGGEVLAGISTPPPVLIATEGWPPNAALARSRLAPLGGVVGEVAEDADLPFADSSFDLVVSRHPVAVRWDEVARVLAHGGVYLSQQVGARSVYELIDFMMGPQQVGDARRRKRAVAALTAAGLDVVDLRSEATRVEFFDVAAVIVFLRKVVWTVTTSRGMARSSRTRSGSWSRRTSRAHGDASDGRRWCPCRDPAAASRDRVRRTATRQGNNAELPRRA